MKKFIFIFTIAALFISSPAAAYAETGPAGAPLVSVRIEGAERVIAHGTAAAYSFREAVEELAAQSNLTLTFIQSGADSKLTGVEGGSIEIGEWLGFVMRDGQLLRRDAYMDIPLRNGDEAVLYQGDAAETKIITHTECAQSEDGLRFFFGVTLTDWAEEDGTWLPLSTITPVENITVHVMVPGRPEQTVITDSSGSALLPFDDFPGGVAPCAASYYAEGYVTGKAPLIVRTNETRAPFGFASEESVTRAEAVAFLFNMFEMKTEAKDNTSPFDDITPQTAWYNEITAAAGLGLVQGYDDGMFRPETPISLMQLCAIAGRLFPDIMDAEALAMGGDTEEDEPETDETEAAAYDENTLPGWASAMEFMLREGMLDGVGDGHADIITPEKLVKLYGNLKR